MFQELPFVTPLWYVVFPKVMECCDHVLPVCALKPFMFV
jgi:hypothetical protein